MLLGVRQKFLSAQKLVQPLEQVLLRFLSASEVSDICEPSSHEGPRASFAAQAY